MNNTNTFKSLFDSARKSLAYKVEGSIVQFTEQVVERMLTLGHSKSALAAKLGTSAPYVTKLLRGGTNFTLESMVKVSDALDSELKIELVPRFSPKDWIGVIEDQNSMSYEQHVWANRRYKEQFGQPAPGLIGPPRPPQLLNPDHEICPLTGY